MTKAQLQDFLRKLETAKRIAVETHYHRNLATVCLQVGLVGLIAGTGRKWLTPNRTFNWYEKATSEQRIAMWDNSISHTKKLIEEAVE